MTEGYNPTEGYTPPYTATPLATDAGTAAPVGGPPSAGYPAPPATSSTETDSSTADVAKDQAAQVGQGAVQAGQHVAGVAKDQAVNVGAEAGRQAKDLLSQAGSELGQQASTQQQRLAQSIRSLGEELHKMTQPGEQASGPAADLARQGAQRSREFASWLEQREPGEVLDEVTSFARRRPGAFLLLAAGAGLLAGRMTRGLKEASSDEAPAGNQLRSTEYGDSTQYGSGVQYGGTTQYGGAQHGEYEGTGVLGTVEEIEVVRPYASSEDGPSGYPTTGGTTSGGTL